MNELHAIYANCTNHLKAKAFIIRGIPLHDSAPQPSILDDSEAGAAKRDPAAGRGCDVAVSMRTIRQAQRTG